MQDGARNPAFGVQRVIASYWLRIITVDTTRLQRRNKRKSLSQAMDSPAVMLTPIQSTAFRNRDLKRRIHELQSAFPTLLSTFSIYRFAHQRWPSFEYKLHKLRATGEVRHRQHHESSKSTSAPASSNTRRGSSRLYIAAISDAVAPEWD